MPIQTAIHLPEELETQVGLLVAAGRYASENEFVAEAVRFLLERYAQTSSGTDQGSIGTLHNDAELLDQAVEVAMKACEERR